MQSLSFLIFVEKMHVFGDTHKNVLRNVDLHQDQNLVESAKGISHQAHVDPLSSIDAK